MFNEDGLTIPTFEEILTSLNENMVANIRAELGDMSATIDTSRNSPLGKLNQIYAQRIFSVWEQALLIQEAMRTDTAQGISLDKAALLVGFLRRRATNTIGTLYFKGDNKTLVREGSLFQNFRRDNFESLEEFTITPESCLQLKMSLGTILPNATYTLTVDAVSYSYKATGSDTYTTILTQLYNQLNTRPGYTTTLFIDPVNEEESYIMIDKDSKTLPMKITGSSYIIFYDILTSSVVRAIDQGVVFGDAYTITTIVSAISGLNEVYNPTDFDLGLEAESEEELRERVQTSFNATGSGTADTIATQIERLAVVRDAIVYENPNFEHLNIGGTTLPPKTYEVVVKHTGPVDIIGQAIWDNKPLGIKTFGQTTVDLEDITMEPVSVMFTSIGDSGSGNKYVHLRISYTQHPEEELPPNAETLIAEACAIYGDTFKINEDVIPKRFYKAVYEEVEGVDDLVIEAALTDNPLTTPTVWSTSRLPIGYREIANFATDRVTFI